MGSLWGVSCGSPDSVSVHALPRAGHAGLGTRPSRMRLLGQPRCWSFSECLYLAPTHPDAHVHIHTYTHAHTHRTYVHMHVHPTHPQEAPKEETLPAGRSSLSLRDFLIRQFRTTVHVRHEINHRDFTFRQTPFSRRPVGRGLCVH